MERVNSDFIEKIMLKGMLTDKNFLVLISSVFESNYFDDPNIGHAFDFCKLYVDEYKDVPSKDIVINSTDTPDDLREVIEQAENVDFDIGNPQSYEFLLDQSNDYLKEKALKQAIMLSVDDVENPERRNAIQTRIQDALTKDVRIDLGLKYFEDVGSRLRRIFTASENRISTGFPVFDEHINGGFPPYTFNVITAKIHGGKSNTMANFAARQVLLGYNVALLSLEMSQDAFAQRFDGIYSKLDVNRMYLSANYKRMLKDALTDVKATENRGELFIKEYPTGEASILNFRSYLRELKMRDVRIDIVYVDYINLMKAAYKVENNMYSSVKRISEELRSLSFEFQCPFVSVSQLNREGFYVNFNELDFSYTAESMGIPATADFMMIMGTDEDQMVYESEILYRITKSRIGRPNQSDKFFLDRRSLKMYDSCELDEWIDDASISGDERAQVTHDDAEDRTEARRGGRRRRD